MNRGLSRAHVIAFPADAWYQFCAIIRRSLMHKVLVRADSIMLCPMLRHNFIIFP